MPVSLQRVVKQGHENTTHAVDPSELAQRWVWLATGSNVETDIKAAVLADAPATVTVDTFTLQQTTLVITRLAATAWQAELNYRAFEYPVPNDIEISFDTDGGSARITQALVHLSDHAPSGVTPANFFGAINVTEQGVEGITIEVPAFTFEYHATMTAASITQAYAATVGGLTKTVNTSSWHGFPAGSLLFRGAKVPKMRKSAPQATIEFRFRYEPLDSARTDANSIALPDRNGHDLLWYSQRAEVDTSASRLIRRSVSAHIDRVYNYGNFNSLGLGASPWP